MTDPLPPSATPHPSARDTDARLVGEPPAEAAGQSLAYLLDELRAQQGELERQNEALRQAQVALEQSRDRYRDLYEFAPVGYLTLTRSGLVDEVNITAATLLGVERDELRGQRFDRFVAAPDRQRWLHKFAAVMARGGLQAFEMAVCGPDGPDGPAEPCQVQVACLRVEADASTEGKGAPAAGRTLRVTLIDISEKKRLGDELEQYRNHLDTLVQRRTAELAAAQAAADSANRVKTSFLTKLSQALRTPMNSIVGLAHMLRRSGVSVQQAEKLDRIDSTGRQLSGLIDGMLDLAKIDAGELALESVDFHPADLVHAIEGEIGGAIRAKGIAWSTDVSDLPPVLRGDLTRLRQALLNYLNNAYRFTERGAIELCASLVEDGEDSCVVRFAVRDTGIGLSAAQQQALFEPFAQGDAVPPESGEGRAGGGLGSGLGLALTRHIALLMGGEVGVDSVEGQGSTFWLTVRLAKVGAPVPSAEPGVADAAGLADVVNREDESNEARVGRRYGGARILLVEDDPPTQEVMLMLLGEAGLAPQLAANGFEAIELAQREAYALILMDVQMPRMSGLDATRAIRALPGRERTPIIALTANVFDENRQACMAAGMNDFVAKPIVPERLFAALLRWLAGDGKG